MVGDRLGNLIVMTDRRRHRGAHPKDAQFFSQAALPALRCAVGDLSWLLSRGYPLRAALALVGDRDGLTLRQRQAIRRCACSDEQRVERRARRATPETMPGAPVWIDGFNLLTTVEAALAGGVLLLARDGALRDMASMHGSYRFVEETRPAIAAVAKILEDRQVECCRWLLDAPVSNSGRLAMLLREFATEHDLRWVVEVVHDPDKVLVTAPVDVLVASADSQIMDGARRTWQLARETVEGMGPTRWILDLASEDGAASAEEEGG
jgi:hypothetical protein